MSQEKYIGMDVHQATISVAVMDASGKLIMECLLETKAATIVEFIQGLQGTLSLTFEEGTSAAWLHDLLKPHVNRLVVCDPRKAALLKDDPLHVMPSRITRNSHRPRASDRTMVAMKHHLACCSLKLDGRVTISRETHENGQQAKLLQGNDTTVGWISRKKSRIRSRENFFLDIPFYRTY